MEWYRPGAVVLQCGADSLAGDRLGCFNLSLSGHNACVAYIKRFNVPTLVLGGGGYTIRNVARCWAIETATVCGRSASDIIDGVADEGGVFLLPTDPVPFNDYFEYYGPEYTFAIPPVQNMSNANTPEYLSACTREIFENLRNLQHAPSVQQQAIPVGPFDSSSDDEEFEDDHILNDSSTSWRRPIDPLDLWAMHRRAMDDDDVVLNAGAASIAASTH